MVCQLLQEEGTVSDLRERISDKVKRQVRFWHAILLRLSYGMSGTDAACGTPQLAAKARVFGYVPCRSFLGGGGAVLITGMGVPGRTLSVTRCY